MKVRLAFTLCASVTLLSCSTPASRRAPRPPSPPDLTDLEAVQFEEPDGIPLAPDLELPKWGDLARPEIIEIEIPEWTDIWTREVASKSRDFKTRGFTGPVPSELGSCAFIFVEDLPADIRISFLSGALQSGVRAQDLGRYTGSTLSWREGMTSEEANALVRLLAEVDDPDAEALGAAAAAAGISEESRQWASIDLGLESPLSDWIARAPWEGIQSQTVCIVHTVKQWPSKVELELIDADQVLEDLQALEAVVQEFNARATEFNLDVAAYTVAWSEYAAQLEEWLNARRLAHKEQGDALSREFLQRRNNYLDLYADYQQRASRFGEPAKEREVLVPPKWEPLPPFPEAPLPSDLPEEVQPVVFESMAGAVEASSKAVVPCIVTRVVAEFIDVASGEIQSTIDVEWTVPEEFVVRDTYLVRDAVSRVMGK